MFLPSQLDGGDFILLVGTEGALRATVAKLLPEIHKLPPSTKMLDL
jgi:hypothetical protein